MRVNLLIVVFGVAFLLNVTSSYLTQATCDEINDLQNEKTDNLIFCKKTKILLVGCQLKVQSDGNDNMVNIDIPLKGDCKFVLDAKNKPQVVNTKLGPTALVFSSTPHATKGFCDTTVRAIVIKNYHVFISKEEQKILSCSPGPFDAKMFHVLAGSIKFQ